MVEWKSAIQIDFALDVGFDCDVVEGGPADIFREYAEVKKRKLQYILLFQLLDLLGQRRRR